MYLPSVRSSPGIPGSTTVGTKGLSMNDKEVFLLCLPTSSTLSSLKKERIKNLKQNKTQLENTTNTIKQEGKKVKGLEAVKQMV